ncbi:MAG: 60S ribosomal protein L22 [Candidatus Bathyarchaeota archaeon]|nr:60S ribosomal protein L22 [Candidatus Bathyarchaeota archaeon]MDH5754372.1 60S ribosomal protein L22 [Candidatus Bathyarchaeota archaeon]
MAETRIDISELKSEGGDVIKELAEFLEEKTKAEVETATNEIIVKGEGKAISKKYLRVLLRKFLHRIELKDYFRVIGGRENTLIVKEKKIAEE